jgi:hypothetical protein
MQLDDDDINDICVDGIPTTAKLTLFWSIKTTIPVFTVYQKVVQLHIRSEVFMVVTMNNAIFWDIMLCGSCEN